MTALATFWKHFGKTRHPKKKMGGKDLTLVTSFRPSLPSSLSACYPCLCREGGKTSVELQEDGVEVVARGNHSEVHCTILYP